MSFHQAVVMSEHLHGIPTGEKSDQDWRSIHWGRVERVRMLTRELAELNEKIKHEYTQMPRALATELRQVLDARVADLRRDLDREAGSR